MKTIYQIAAGALALLLAGVTVLAIVALATEDLPPLQTYGEVGDAPARPMSTDPNAV